MGVGRGVPVAFCSILASASTAMIAIVVVAVVDVHYVPGALRSMPSCGRDGWMVGWQSHTTGVRSRQEMEELEEEKRLAEEERRFKENLRQKARPFPPS